MVFARMDQPNIFYLSMRRPGHILRILAVKVIQLNPHGAVERLGLYGFINTYRHSGDERFLNTAKRIAHYFISALPEDQVPYWDFRLADDERMFKDSSAASIAASGLLELAAIVPVGEKVSTLMQRSEFSAH